MFKLCRVFGIDIFLHWSLAALVVILFPMIYPIIANKTHDGMFVSGLTTLIICVAFIASVLFHELAHSLVGKQFGIVMDRITLFVFGGAASIRGELKRPAHEFWMALAGPVSSIVLGFVLLGVALLMGGHRTLGLTFSMLASVNVGLGVMNLAPCFPLDGGRLVRAFVWWMTKSYRKATVFSATTGKMLAAGFMLMGAFMAAGLEVPFFGTGLFNGLWIVFMGWLIYGMAGSELKAAKESGRA